MTDLDLVKKAAREYDDEIKTSKADNKTNDRLIVLVDKHGIDAVSAATGLKPSSIVLYTSRKTAPQVSETAVTKAENILSQF